MKILAIDVGNTRAKWGVHDGRGWLHKAASPTIDLDQLHAGVAGAGTVDRVVIANVAGDVIRRALAAGLPRDVPTQWMVSEAFTCGVRSSYANPLQLGVDRLAALVGARHLTTGACVVVNAGTTMTVDALSADSIFLGGFIVPGFDLMRSALDHGTAQLRRQDGAFSFFPDNTADAIASGALNALAGAVERMCRYMIDAAEEEPTVMLSGGNADVLQPRLNGRIQVVDNLVLEGLVRIAVTEAAGEENA